MSLSLPFLTQKDNTPLIVASHVGNVEVVKELLSSGATVDMQNKVHYEEIFLKLLYFKD